MKQILSVGLIVVGLQTAAAETVPLMWAIPGHGGGVPGVAVSPDGRWVATGSEDDTVKLWRADDGRLVWTAPLQFGAARVAFTPDSQVVYAGTIGGATAWDTRTAENLGVFGQLETGVAVDVSRDGQFLAVGGSLTGGEDSVRVIRISDGAIVESFDINSPQSGAQYNFSLQFSANGARLFAGSGNIFGSQNGTGKLRVWDLATNSVIHEIEAHSRRVSGLALSPDGAVLASAGGDGAIRLWDAGTMAPIRTIPTGATAVYDVKFSPDGARIAAGQSNGVLRTWDVATGAKLAEVAAHAGAAGSVAWTPSGDELFTSSGIFLETPQNTDNAVRVWAADDLSNVRTLTRFAGQMNFADTAVGAGRMVAAVGHGVDVLGIADQATVRNIPATGFVNDCAISADGSRIALLDATVARVHDVATGALVRSVAGPTSPFTQQFGDLALSPNGDRLAIVSRDGVVRVWNLASGTVQATFTPFGFGTNDLAFSPDGTQIYTGGSGTYLWNAANGALIRNHPIGSQAVNDVTFSADGARIAACTTDGFVRVWNRADGKLLTDISTGLGWNTAVALSADGTMVASAKRIDLFLGGPQILIWNIANGVLLTTIDNESPSTGVALDFINGDRQLLHSRVDGTTVALENPVRGRSGDLNCDGAITVSDIGAFVLALTDPSGYPAAFPGCSALNADVTADGVVTVADIGRFVERLTD